MNHRYVSLTLEAWRPKVLGTDVQKKEIKLVRNSSAYRKIVALDRKIRRIHIIATYPFHHPWKMLPNSNLDAYLAHLEKNIAEFYILGENLQKKLLEWELTTVPSTIMNFFNVNLEIRDSFEVHPSIPENLSILYKKRLDSWMARGKLEFETSAKTRLQTACNWLIDAIDVNMYSLPTHFYALQGRYMRHCAEIKELINNPLIQDACDQLSNFLTLAEECIKMQADKAVVIINRIQDLQAIFQLIGESYD